MVDNRNTYGTVSNPDEIPVYGPGNPPPTPEFPKFLEGELEELLADNNENTQGGKDGEVANEGGDGSENDDSSSSGDESSDEKANEGDTTLPQETNPNNAEDQNTEDPADEDPADEIPENVEEKNEEEVKEDNKENDEDDVMIIDEVDFAAKAKKKATK